MCGIVGYVGSENCIPAVTEAMERLEYRGYDSMGIAVSDGKRVLVKKTVGKFKKFMNAIETDEIFSGSIAIGHTRWATHGKPCVTNAHPHEGKHFVMVHNGIIENFESLKERFLSTEVFESDTDTEVALKLLEVFYKTSKNVSSAIRMLFDVLEGSYAFCIMDKKNPEALYAVKNKSPLLIGSGNGFNMVGSDVNAMAEKVSHFFDMKDKEYAIVTRDNIEIYSHSGEKKIRMPFEAEFSREESGKGTYPHYMLKEIEQQPAVVRKLAETFVNEKGEMIFDSLLISELKKCDRIYIVACGTSYHSALMGKMYFEKISGIGAEAVMAGEFTSLSSVICENPFFIFISQSGETADCLSALSVVKKSGYPTLSVTNSKMSGLSRSTDFTLWVDAGQEISVASTKAYTAQALMMYLLSNAVSGKKNLNIGKELKLCSAALDNVCKNKEVFRKIVQTHLKNVSAVFYMGKGADYYASLEGALKLKEISYIQTTGIAASELKHGTLALMEDGVAVFAFVTQGDYEGSIRSNINEVLSRGAKVCVISTDTLCRDGDAFSFHDTNEFVSPIIAVVCSQYIAYFTALDRGLDIDRPRNLAKSVTVE